MRVRRLGGDEVILEVVGDDFVCRPGGAAGTIGLAQFVNSAKGDPNAIMVSGATLVGSGGGGHEANN